MANHSSGLDPFLVAAIFLLGYIYGHVPIKRSSRESAIKSLNKAARKMKSYGKNICVFPEGTRTSTGRMLPLKSGPFYMAEEGKCAVTPIYIYGAYDLMSKGAIVPSHGGVVVVEYQQQIPYLPDMNHEKLKEAVEKSLREAEARWAGKILPKGGYSLWWCSIPIVVLLSIIFLVYSNISIGW